MRKLFILVSALAALGGLAAFAHADVIQTFSVSTPPAKAGKPIALNVNETTADTAGPSVQAPPLTRQKIRFQKGGKFNGNKFPRCKKATIVATTVCPSKSKIGSGKATAVALPIVPLVNAPLTLWNGEKQAGHDTVYVFAIPDIGPNLLTIGEISKAPSGSFDYLLDFKIDPIQTLPGAPNASVTSVQTSTPKKTIKKGKKKIALVVAPTKCSGKWNGQGEFEYTPNDGSALVTKTVPVSVNCKK